MVNGYDNSLIVVLKIYRKAVAVNGN